MKYRFLNHIKRLYFPVFVGVALLVYTAQQLSFTLPYFINNYANDLLCMPIVLKICQYAVRYFNTNKKVQIPIRIALTLTLLYSIYFELILPKLSTRYTADVIDVAMYGAGLMFFIAIERFRIGGDAFLAQKKNP